jgi:hypothetical protein
MGPEGNLTAKRRGRVSRTSEGRRSRLRGRQEVIAQRAGCRELPKAGGHAKSRQGVAARLFAHGKTVSLLAVSLPGCSQAASDRPAQRRSIRGSGRRDSNPRQPAWKADRRNNAARLLSYGPRRAFTNHVRHPSSNVADGHTLWEADAYLRSLPSYLPLFEKARPIGNMFHMTMVPILAQP